MRIMRLRILLCRLKTLRWERMRKPGDTATHASHRQQLLQYLVIYSQFHGSALHSSASAYTTGNEPLSWRVIGGSMSYAQLCLRDELNIVSVWNVEHCVSQYGMLNIVSVWNGEHCVRMEC